jgi:hypothetical protein
VFFFGFWGYIGVYEYVLWGVYGGEWRDNKKRRKRVFYL